MGAAQGSMGQLIATMVKSPAKWITQESWQECQQLSEKILAFSGICSHISNHPQYWLNFCNANEPFKLLHEYNREDVTVGKSLSFFILKLFEVFIFI